ncbi:MAG: phage baseplate assembly protein V [Novosphingobium sp.]
MEDEDDLAGKIGDLIRLGLVLSVDLGEGLAVVQCGDVESPPCPWIELAGQFRSWRPPSVGEQVLLVCPEGDIAAGVIVRGLFSDSFPAPAADENHHFHGPDGLTIKLTGDGIEIAAPGDVKITGDVKVTGKITATNIITSDVDVIARPGTARAVSLVRHMHSSAPNDNAPEEDEGP